MSAIDPLTDIQIVAHGDFGDLGILRVSWPFSRIEAIKAISAAALGLIPNQVQQRCCRDHHQGASEAERDLHRKPIRDVDQRYVAGERK
jgi:hypothetical protein